MSDPSLLVVVARYGDVPGGAEAHARSVVQRLKPSFAIEVATTTATAVVGEAHCELALTNVAPACNGSTDIGSPLTATSRLPSGPACNVAM